jgi:hypothetical protein
MPPPPAPLALEASASPLDTLAIGPEEGLEGNKYVERPKVDFDNGQDNPYRYVHGAPLHNVVEEEEESREATHEATIPCGACCHRSFQHADSQIWPLVPLPVFLYFCQAHYRECGPRT